MPKPNRNRRHHSSQQHRQGNPQQGAGRQVGASAANAVGPVPAAGIPPAPIPLGRYDAPGDGPMVTEARLTLQETFRVEPALFDRLRRRDVNVKEAFTIRDGSGEYFRASLREMTPAGGAAIAYEKMVRSPEPLVEITLACAVLARQRMIFVVQKATELGATSIVPLLTDHSVPSGGLEHERANAWPAQVARAAKQCRRASLPAVLPPMSLEAFMQTPTFTEADARVLLDDRSDPAAAATQRPRKIVLFIGPEGGFSDAERAKLTPCTTPWFLGGRILRAETAVLVGLTAVQMTWGDFAV